MKPWYSQAAKDWNEALPIGNGFMGGMVYGGMNDEQIDLNERTLWSGFPRDDINYEARRYLNKTRALTEKRGFFEAQELIEKFMLGRGSEAYQPLGTLRISSQIDGDKNLKVSGSQPDQYRRELNLYSSLWTVTSEVGEVRETREAFASHPDRIIVYRWSVGSGALDDLLISLECPHSNTVVCEGSSLKLLAQLPTRVMDNANFTEKHPHPVLYEAELGLGFQLLLTVQIDGGTVGNLGENALRVQDAKSVTVFLTAASNFQAWNVMPEPNDPAPGRQCRHRRDAAAKSRRWAEIAARAAEAWEGGTVRGLLAQGGLEVDMTWKDHKLVH